MIRRSWWENLGTSVSSTALWKMDNLQIYTPALAVILPSRTAPREKNIYGVKGLRDPKQTPRDGKWSSCWTQACVRETQVAQGKAGRHWLAVLQGPRQQASLHPLIFHKKELEFPNRSLDDGSSLQKWLISQMA